MPQQPQETVIDRPALDRVGDGDLRSDVRLLTYMVGQLDKKFEELKANFATKAELADVREDVAALKSGVWWVIKIVGGAVIAAVLGLVLIKGGVPHL